MKTCIECAAEILTAPMPVFETESLRRAEVHRRAREAVFALGYDGPEEKQRAMLHARRVAFDDALAMMTQHTCNGVDDGVCDPCATLWAAYRDIEKLRDECLKKLG